MKQCPACLKLGIGPKDESEFYSSKRDGIQSRCKSCGSFGNFSAEAKKRYRDVKRVRYVGGERLVQIERASAWAKANPERAAKNSRASHQREEYKIRARERTKNWQMANPAKVAAYSAQRRALELQRTPAWANKNKIEDFYAQAQAAREFFDEVEWHVDHIVPLKGTKASGLHVHDNLQVIPGIENLRKSNRSQIEFGKDMRDLVRAAKAAKSLQGEKGPAHNAGTPIESNAV